MPKKKIPHGALVFVGDGRKALFLRNEGDEKFANLQVERVFQDDTPPTRELGTDRAGRVFASAGSDRRGAVEAPDWHDLEERVFVRKVAEAMEKLVRERRVKELIVVAPPRTLAELRHAFHDDVKACIHTEINKDLTKHPINEIENYLVGEIR